MTNNTLTKETPPQHQPAESSGAAPCSPCFVVLAFRYGGHGNTFPIGVFPTRVEAEAAARAHRYFRGGKYDHRVYEFEAGKANDDVGHAANNLPCIEANAELRDRSGSGTPTTTKPTE